MSRNEHFNSGSGNHDQECYGCGATGNSNHFGMGNNKKCSYCGSSEVHYARTEEDRYNSRSDIINRLTSAGHDIQNISIDESSQPHVKFSYGNWIGRYKGGGIDIAHASNPDSAVAFIPLHDYENNSPKTIGPEELRQHMVNWAEEDGETYLKNL